MSEVGQAPVADDPDEHAYGDQAQSGARSDRPALAALMTAAGSGELTSSSSTIPLVSLGDNHLMLSIIAELHFDWTHWLS
jgi:hypothetical protein